MKKYIFIMFILLTVSCHQKEKENLKENKKNIRKNLDNPIDTLFFIDGLLIKNGLRLVNKDTCAENSKILTFVNRISPLNNIAKNSENCIKYTFKTKSNNQIIITILQIIYKKSNDAKIIFNRIKNEALLRKGVPGLTYTNDIVIKNDNIIYWFNSPCLLSFKNHKNYFDLLSDYFNIKQSEYIYCKCGKVVCNVHKS